MYAAVFSRELTAQMQSLVTGQLQYLFWREIIQKCVKLCVSVRVGITHDAYEYSFFVTSSDPSFQLFWKPISSPKQKQFGLKAVGAIRKGLT